MKTISVGILSFLVFVASLERMSAGESIYITNSVGIVLRKIPAGEFLAGSPPGEVGRDMDERQHRQIISNSFYIATMEVTRKQWKDVIGDNEQPGSMSLPVSRVSYQDALAFCKKLSGKEGSGRMYRLPSEMEWEYACRAGSVTAFGGNGRIADMGWTYADIGKFKTDEGPDCLVSVGGKKLPNAWGLFDMHGNVKEWTSDIIFKQESKPDPLEVRPPPSGPKKKCRIVRGGSLVSQPSACRSAFRDWQPEETVSTDIGFRIVMDVSHKK